MKQQLTCVVVSQHVYLEGMIVVFFIFEVCDVTQTVSLLVSDFNESREALLGALEFKKKTSNQPRGRRLGQSCNR